MTSDSERRRLSPDQAARLRAELEGTGEPREPTADAGRAEASDLMRSITSPGGEAGPVAGVPLDSLGIPGVSIVRRIGRGGMGVVLEGSQTVPVRRRVAVKLILPGRVDADFRARFGREMALLASVEHPNVARLYDAGHTRVGDPYFLMEYVEGKPLAEHCDARRLTLAERVALLVDVAEAVQFLHARQIVHRDLKPDNVLVHEVAGRPIVKVIDFGLARPIERDEHARTADGSPVGSVRYMAPEQTGRAESGPAGGVDASTDVFALGTVLHELIAGDTPISRHSDSPLPDLLRQINEGEAPPPSRSLARNAPERAFATRTGRRALLRECRRDLDAIVGKARAVDKRDRYASADALAADLRAYLDGRPVSARPATGGYVAGRFLRRNWPAVAAAVLLVASLAAGVVATARQRDRARLAESEAVAARGQAERTAAGERAAKERAEEALATARRQRRTLVAAGDILSNLLQGFSNATLDRQSLVGVLRTRLQNGLQRVKLADDPDSREATDLRTAIVAALNALDRSDRDAAARTDADLDTTGVLLRAIEALRADDFRAALGALEEGSGGPDGDGGAAGLVEAFARLVRAELAQKSGDPQAAAAELGRAGDATDAAAPWAGVASAKIAKMKGDGLFLAGRYSDAAASYADAVDAYEASRPEADSELQTARENRAVALSRAGDHEAAAAAYDRVIAAWRSVLPESSPEVSEARIDQAVGLFRAGRPRAAVDVLEAVVETTSSTEHRLWAAYERLAVLDAAGTPAPPSDRTDLMAEIDALLPNRHWLREHARAVGREAGDGPASGEAPEPG